MERIRIGIVGLGENTRLRHVPGFRQCDDVTIDAVCNRQAESTTAVAREFGIPKTYNHWRHLVGDPEIDAVVIGTWPYMHCEITLAALSAGKHVLTEARMAMNAREAHEMYDASRRHPDLVSQIVPSPFGLEADRAVKEMISSGLLGNLREVVVLGTNSAFADSSTPLHWRQCFELSGVNMLALGILHETLIRWVPDPLRVVAQRSTFAPERLHWETGDTCLVDIPDSIHVLTELPRNARGVYYLSGVAYHGPEPQIHLYGSKGTIKCMFAPRDRVFAADSSEEQLREVVLQGDSNGWRVEEDFIEAIRGRKRIEFTDFETGVRYMEFTEAVWPSSETSKGVTIPLRDL